MADDADFVSELLLREQEGLLAAFDAAHARRAQGQSHCDHCGDALLVHRKPYGRCVACQEDVERDGRRGLR